MPRIAALHMLRSTMKTVSAPAGSSFRGSLPHPTQPLCTLRVRRHRRLTQHSLPGGLLGLTWAGLTPADRGAFAYSGRGNPITCRERRKLHAAAGEEPVGSDEQGIGARARKGGKDRVDLADCRRVQNLDLQSEGARCFRYGSSPTPKTMGIVVVAALAANAAGWLLPGIAITAIGHGDARTAAAAGLFRSPALAAAHRRPHDGHALRGASHTREAPVSNSGRFFNLPSPTLYRRRRRIFRRAFLLPKQGV